MTRNRVTMTIAAACTLVCLPAASHALITCRNTTTGDLVARSTCLAGEVAANAKSIRLLPRIFAGALHSLQPIPDAAPNNWPSGTVATLNVPIAGTFHITGKADVGEWSGTATPVRCVLKAGGDYDEANAGLLNSDEMLSFDFVHTFAAAGPVSLLCTDWGVGPAQIWLVRIAAQEVQGSSSMLSAPPDLIPINMDNLGYCTNDTNYFYVKNQGPSWAPASTARIGRCNVDVAVPALSPGAVLFFPVPAGCDRQDEITVDFYNAAAESDEGNNSSACYIMR
ncbi:MAG: hypothetical protein HY699_04890 [Deltaproteobacteria bacterium]|nr:hypothetical protein [Deltaproteobacteria bacterium]